MHIIKKKQRGDGTNANLVVDSEALIDGMRRSITNNSCQNCKQGRGGWQKEGRREVGSQSLPPAFLCCPTEERAGVSCT